MKALNIVKISLMCALTIVGAYITIPLPNLPFTLQTFFALLSGLLLSRRDAMVSQLVYIALGLIGLPVFSMGGGGISYILRPTFGYIVCLPLLAFTVASLKEKRLWLSVYLSLVMLLIIGGVWMILVTRLYMARGIMTLIFTIIILYIPVEIVKGTVVILIYKRLKNILP